MAEHAPAMQPVDFDPFADEDAPATLALTAPQREMLAAAQMSTEASCAYNQCIVLRFHGALSLPSMQRALAQVVARHESLRLRIHAEAESQEVLDAIDVALPLVDFSAATEAERGAALAALLDHETRTAFDLALAPLWRAQVVRESADAHRLVFTAHHIVCDGWSSAVIFSDLATCYVADRFGLPPALPAAASLREFVAAGDSPTAHDELHAAEAFWLAQYTSGVPAFELPLDRPRPRLKTFAAAREVLRIDATLYAAVKQMGAKQGCTFFVTLLAAFEALLVRLSGSEELVLGVPMASQAMLDNGHLVAHGVNTIALRSAVAMQQPFNEHLQATRKRFLDAQAHQSLTFGALVQRLKLPRDPSRTPLVNVTFNIDKLGAPFDFGELALQGIDTPKAFANFELAINAVDSGRDVLVECDYNADLFDASTVQRWLGHYLVLLAGAVQAPSANVGALPLLGAAQRAALSSGQTALVYPRAATLHEQFEQQVQRHPAALALTAFATGGVRLELSYDQLNQRANQVAHRLRALGVQPNQLVGLRTGRDADMVLGILGILKAGAGYLPLDPVYPKERVTFMLDDANVRVVLTQSSLAAELSGIDATLVCLDEPLAGDNTTPANLAGASAAEDLAYVIYTSGSTGKPKGVRISHHNVSRLFASTQAWFGFDERDVWTLFHSYSFDFSVWEMWGALLHGGRLVTVSLDISRSTDAFRELLLREGVTVLNQTPTAFRQLMAVDAAQPRARFALRHVIFGGEALELQSLRPWIERHGDARPQLINMYGITETTVHVTYRPITLADLNAGTGSVIGVPLPDLKLYILDPNGEPVPVGLAGEMAVAGAGVSLGYLNRPALTAQRFVHDPFDADPQARMYRSGDLARRLANGDIEYLGRMDQQVKLRGFRIELGEIEAAIAQHPSVRQVAVVAREDVPGDKRLVAYLVSPGAQAEVAEQLRGNLRAVLPDYMVPAHFVFVPALPLTPNGKLDRAALPAPAPLVAAARQRIAARNDAEHRVADAMAQVLGLGPGEVSVDDDFFALGGHSLLAARLAAHLSLMLPVRLPMRTVFDAPTVAQLAALLVQHEAASTQAAAPILARADQREAPASLMQQRIWFLEQMDAGRPTYNAPLALRLKGRLNLAALHQALNALVERHAVLRTQIDVRDGAPVQRVMPHGLVALPPLEDLSALPVAGRELALGQALRLRCAEVIDLRSAPLFRLGLYRLAPHEHVLFFMPHHVIWDGASSDLFHHEMAALYRAHAQGEAPSLAKLMVSYGDFSQWQQSWLVSADLQRQLTHWKDLLANPPEALELPFDKPRPARMSGQGGNERLALAHNLVAGARRVGQQANATLFMTLLAAYAALLSRITGRLDFIIGTPVRGRHTAEVEQLLGFFTNALPLRITVAPERPFAELLQHVRSVVLDAFSHPDVPFEQLVRELKVARDESRSPIYQTIFSYQDVRHRNAAWGNLDVQEMHIATAAAQVDLGLWFAADGHGVAADFQFNADVLSGDTAHRLRRWYEVLLQAAVATPQLAVSGLALVPEADHQQLAQWNDTRVAVSRERTVAAVIAARAGVDGHRIALRSGQDSVTHGELDACANRLAHVLRARGIGRGARVGLCIERSIDMVVTQLAILKSGAAYVPLDPAYPAERLAYMVHDAKLALLVSHSSLAAVLDWPREATVLVDSDAALLAAQPGTPPAPDATLDARAEDAAYAIYTSGSTGKPKGVVVPHRAVVNFLASMARQPGLSAADKLLAVTTLSFDIAVLELLLPLCVGAEIVLASRDDAMSGPALRALVEASAATVLQATPATWHMLLEAGWQGAPAFKALVGGESLHQGLAVQLLQRCGQLWNMYGPTETTVWSTCCQVEHPEQGISIGRPIANTQVHVLDAQGQPCPIGVAGEIFIGGLGVALGYLHRPELSAERFTADPFDATGQGRLYRTGDRGRWLSSGMLEHQGRLDLQVKLRGHRIELGEIEANLLTQAQVAQAVVVVREDTPGDQRLVAYIVPRDAMPTAVALREHLRRVLPAYMLPQHVVAISAMPLLPNGKVDRRGLPAPAVHGGEPAVPVQQVLSASEARLVGLWEEMLGINGVHVTDNFFDLGGHSLLAMRLAARMERELGLRIDLRRLTYESLSQLAAGAARADAALAPSPAPPEPPAPARGGLLNRLLGKVAGR